jgi:hypothetical protein
MLTLPVLFIQTSKGVPVMPKATARIGGLAVVLLLAFAPASLPAAPATEAKKSEFPAEKVRKALDQTIDLDVADQPLVNAINQLKELTKVNIVVDHVLLAQNGIDVNTAQISVKKQGVKARTALREVLGTYHLSYAILGENVFVTTEDMALYRQLKQKVNLDLEKTPFETALKDLARETAVQILVDKKVAKEAQAPVSLQLDDVPLETAVRLLCEQAELKPVRMGNVLYVTSVARAKELRAEPELAPAAPPGIIGGGPPPGALANPPAVGMPVDSTAPAAPSKDP